MSLSTFPLCSPFVVVSSGLEHKSVHVEKMSFYVAKQRREFQTVLNPHASFIVSNRYRRHVELMLSNLVCMSATSRSRIMSALLVVWKSSSTCYKLRCEFSGHKKLIKLIRHGIGFKDFCSTLICTNLVVFCSNNFQHSNAWWLSYFIVIWFFLSFITWMIVESSLSANIFVA